MTIPSKNIINDDPKRCLAYLSGAPRVSTQKDTALPGPRAHVLGVIQAFQRLGWNVKPFIVGDHVPHHWVANEQLEKGLRSSSLKRFLADLLRIQMGISNGWRAQHVIHQADWVYERFGAFQSLGWWFKRQGFPWILETNAILFRESTEDRNTVAFAGLLKLFEQAVYRRCDVLICVSQALANLITNKVGINPEKVIVVPNGVDEILFNPNQHKAKRFFEQPTVGFVGQLSAWQRLDLLIESLAELRSEGICFNLVVIGDGSMRNTWEQLSYSFDQAKYVNFVGSISWEEVPTYIAGIDIGYAGAVPLADGSMYLSPLKLYEYAAMGKPILATAYKDAQQLTAKGTYSYLFKPNNKDDLKKVLRKAYAEREHWIEFGAQLRRIVLEKHTWEARVSELITKIEPILEAKYGTPYPSRR